MSGFPYHNGPLPDGSSLQNSGFVRAQIPLKKDEINVECLQGIPFYFGSMENANNSYIDATEIPLSGLVWELNKTCGDDQNADTGVTTQTPKRRMKNNSTVALRKKDEKKMKANKIEKEGQSPGTLETGYVHVRARRGQATDSHSLAERVRREKIGERMKLLQSLVPGCDKIAGKAQVLEEIINYVQSLQTQLQILEEKLSVLTPYASNYENIAEDIAPPATMTESICSLEESLSCMMESKYNLLHFADDSQHNSSLVSASSSLTSSLGDQKYLISQGAEIPMRKNDVQGHIISVIDQYWLDHLAQFEYTDWCNSSKCQPSW